METMPFTYDPEIAAKTFADLRKLGIGVPLGPVKGPDYLPMADLRSPAQLRALGIEPPKPVRHRKAPKGYGQAHLAFAKALDNRGFTMRDTSGALCEYRDATHATRGAYRVDFRPTGWALSSGKKTLVPDHPYKGGSVKVVDRHIP